MMRILLSLVLFCFALAAAAQTNCPPPTLKLYHNNKELTGSTSERLSSVTLFVQPEISCPAATQYEVVRGKAYLIRNGSPVTVNAFDSSYVQLGNWLPLYQSGDRISIVLTHMYLVSGKEQKKPYTQQIFKHITIK